MPDSSASQPAASAISRWIARVDRLLAVLAGLALVAAFVSVMLGVVARLAGWDVPGTDAYAGYAIAAALFLALPQTLRRSEHIRVTLLLEKLPPRGRAALQWWSIGAGLALALFIAFYAVRLVWVSQDMHDVSQGADATPLWIPQIAMALGCIGFALSMADALWCRLRGAAYFHRIGAEASHVE